MYLEPVHPLFWRLTVKPSEREAFHSKQGSFGLGKNHGVNLNGSNHHGVLLDSNGNGGNVQVAVFWVEPLASKHLVRRHVDLKNIPKTLVQEVFGRLGEVYHHSFLYESTQKSRHVWKEFTNLMKLLFSVCQNANSSVSRVTMWKGNGRYMMLVVVKVVLCI